ncbi:MAG: LTA synthase family protein [Acidobacteriota bacterium]|nr:LTA synthase family protein [Acidobacteriota bacterium]
MILLLIPSRRWRAWAAWSVVTVASLLLLSDRLYDRWFGDLFPTVAILSAGHLGQIVGNAWDIASARDAWLMIDVLTAVPLVLALSRRPQDGRAGRYARGAMALVVGLVLLVAGWKTTSAVKAQPSIVTQRFSNRALVEHTGPLVYHVFDAGAWIRRTITKELLTDDLFTDVGAWLARRQPQRAGTGPWFGIASGMNLVVIQVESLQAQMVDLRINRREVMPNLRKLRSTSVSFSRLFDQTGEGRTSDAEWMGLTSILPASHGAAAFIDEDNHLVGLPTVLGGRGYQSLSAVAFAPTFWNRRVMHPKFGFSRSLFSADFSPGEVIGWGLNDRDFLLQMVPQMTFTPAPFAAWLITQSLHYPFETFPRRLKQLDVAPWNDTPFGNYVHGMHYFDRALGEFLASLNRAGLLANTVVAVTGDHSAGFPWSRDLAHVLGFSNEMLQWHLSERVPLIISVPGAPPASVDMPAGQIDIAPTLLALLGVDPAGLPYLGRNMLGNPVVEPVVRRNGGWVDANHLFTMKGNRVGTHCYSLETFKDVPLEDCAKGGAIASQQVDVARRIREFDIQQRLLAEDPAGHRHEIATRPFRQSSPH